MNARVQPMWIPPSRLLADAAACRIEDAHPVTRASGVMQAKGVADTRLPASGARRRRCQRGQAYVEYLVILLMLMAMLFAGDPDPVDQVMTAVQDAYSRFTYALSLP